MKPAKYETFVLQSHCILCNTQDKFWGKVVKNSSMSCLACCFTKYLTQIRRPVLLKFLNEKSPNPGIWDCIILNYKSLASFSFFSVYRCHFLCGFLRRLVVYRHELAFLSYKHDFNSFPFVSLHAFISDDCKIFISAIKKEP